ncbi:MAG: DUF4920 domain-containing protein [Anaeromyxobacter sp.]
MRLAVLAVASALAASPALAGTTGPGTTYGAGVGKAQLVKISELTANPDRYVGKTVRVEGLVTDVCARRGCWMELAGDKEFQTMRIKVDDGEIVFPMTAKGKVAQAEGVFTKFEVPAERVLAMKQHEAEEKGVPFDPKTAKVEPMVVYQIKGVGAVIR